MTVNNKRVFYVKYLANEIYVDILKARPDVRLDRLENDSPDTVAAPILSAALLPWFFLTPVLYSLDAIPGAEAYPWLVDLVHWGNPVTPAVESFRDPLFFGELPAAGDVLYLVVATVVSLALGVPGSPVFVSAWWLAFTAFVGLNLLQSSFTRWCPLEIILRRFGVQAGC